MEVQNKKNLRMLKLPRELILQEVGKHLEFEDAIKLSFLSKDFRNGTRTHCKSIVTKLENLRRKLCFFQSETVEIKVRQDSQVDDETIGKAMDIIKKASVKNLYMDIRGKINHIDKILSSLNLSLDTLRIMIKRTCISKLPVFLDLKNINVKRLDINSIIGSLTLKSSDNALKELEEIRIEPLIVNFCEFKMESVKANKVIFYRIEQPSFTRDFNMVVNAKKLLFYSCAFDYVSNFINITNSDIDEIVFQRTRSYDGHIVDLKISIDNGDLKKLILESEKRLLSFDVEFRMTNLRIRDFQCENCNLYLWVRNLESLQEKSEIRNKLFIDTLNIDWSILDEVSTEMFSNNRYIRIPESNVSNLNIKTAMEKNELEFNSTKIENLVFYICSEYSQVLLRLKDSSISTITVFIEKCEKPVIIKPKKPFTGKNNVLEIIAKKDTTTISSDVSYTLQE